MHFGTFRISARGWDCSDKSAYLPDPALLECTKYVYTYKWKRRPQKDADAIFYIQLLNALTKICDSRKTEMGSFTTLSLQTLRTQTIMLLFPNQNICCGYSKEPSQWYGSFEHSKHMLKWMGKKIFKILRSKLCLSKRVNFTLAIFQESFSCKTPTHAQCNLWQNL